MIITYTDGTTQTVSVPAKEGNILEYMLLEDGTYGVYAGSEAKKQTIITIPDVYNGATVTQILSGAFMDFDKLQQVVFPSDLVRIGKNAFNGCISLDNVTMPDTVTEIGDYAFNDCQSISALSFNAQLQSIGRYAFYGCSSLTSITIPASVTFIGKYSFYDTSLTYAKLENTEGWDFLERDDFIIEGNNTGTLPLSYSNICFSYYNSSGDGYKFNIDANIFIKRVSAKYQILNSNGNISMSGHVSCNFYVSDWIRK